MRLEPLYRVTFTTPESWSVELEGTTGTEGQSFLIAEGRSEGRLSARYRAANFPRRRTDGALTPDFRGVLETDDGATILFSWRGGAQRCRRDARVRGKHHAHERRRSLPLAERPGGRRRRRGSLVPTAMIRRGDRRRRTRLGTDDLSGRTTRLLRRDRTGPAGIVRGSRARGTPAGRRRGRFMMLVEQHQAMMLRIARMYVSSQAVAEEVVGDAWLGILQGLDKFEGDRRCGRGCTGSSPTSRRRGACAKAGPAGLGACR